MKPFPAGLDTLLATGVYVYCDLYDFTLWDATHLRYTTADTNVLYSGSTYTSRGPFFDTVSSKSKAHWKAGLDLDSWIVQVVPAPVDPITGASFPAQIYNQPWLAAVRAGALRGAVVDIHRLYFAAWPQPWTSPLNAANGYVLVDIFAGRVAEIDVTRSDATITINSFVEILSRPMPRNLYQAPCRWTLFDTGCAITDASFKATGTVVALLSQSAITASGITALGTTDGYYALGRLVWLTGGNVGFPLAIRNYQVTGGTLEFIRPAPFTIAVGDTFTAIAGCDKTLATCIAKFNNKVSFGGFPFVPQAETGV